MAISYYIAYCWRQNCYCISFWRDEYRKPCAWMYDVEFDWNRVEKTFIIKCDKTFSSRWRLQSIEFKNSARSFQSELIELKLYVYWSYIFFRFSKARKSLEDLIMLAYGLHCGSTDIHLPYIWLISSGYLADCIQFCSIDTITFYWRTLHQSILSSDVSVSYSLIQASTKMDLSRGNTLYYEIIISEKWEGI